MATKRKVRRFDEGGMTDEEVASFAGTPENDSNAGMAEATKEPETKTRTFKEAFAAARKSGDKVFEWNGKKYTSDLATDKKTEPRVNGRTFAEDVAERKKNAVATSMARNENYGNEGRRQVNKPTGRGVINTSNLDKNTLLPKMAKGGSVSSASRRADGIASKGKTKGRMV